MASLYTGLARPKYAVGETLLPEAQFGTGQEAIPYQWLAGKRKACHRVPSHSGIVRGASFFSAHLLVQFFQI
jgi:hypothetical protein